MAAQHRTTRITALPEMTHQVPIIPGVEIRKLLDRGATSQVWLGHVYASAADVAIKVLWAGLAARELPVARFRRETRVLSLLRHPNIIRMHGMGETENGWPFLMMEYAPKGSMRQFLDKYKRVTPDSVARVVTPIADALASAHESEVVHRDIKPGNILFAADKRPLLADFGLCLLLDDDDRLTDTHVRLGTPDYAAPEQAISAAAADPRSDQYSLGATVYEMLSGQPPKPRPPDWSPIPEAARPVLQRAMADEPDDRFDNVREFAKQLTAALSVP